MDRERDLAAENRRLREALTVLLEEAEGFNVSGVYFDEPCMGHKGPALARAALDAEPASGEGFDGPIMAQLVQNNNILRARVAKLEEALLDATAHLAGATSAYEKFVGRHNRQGHRDALFETRFSDFTKATDRARAALATEPASGEREREICECPDCGRTHKKMPFSTPPYGLRRRQLVRLSLLFNQGAHLGTSDDQQINDWLKERLRKAYENGDHSY